ILRSNLLHNLLKKLVAPRASLASYLFQLQLALFSLTPSLPLHFLITHRVATNKTPALEYYFVLSLSTLFTVRFVRNHCLAQPYPLFVCKSFTTTHTRTRRLNYTFINFTHTVSANKHNMDKFLIRKSQKEKPVNIFKHKRDCLQQQRTTISKQCLEASYVVAHRIAKLGKPHTIAESLVLRAAQDMCRIMIDDSAAAKVQYLCQMTLYHAEYQKCPVISKSSKLTTFKSVLTMHCSWTNPLTLLDRPSFSLTSGTCGKRKFYIFKFFSE